MKNYFILLFGVILLSCNKKNIDDYAIQPNHLEAYTLTSINYWDSVGIVHNQSLDFLSSYSGFEEFSFSQKAIIFDAFFDSIGLSTFDTTYESSAFDIYSNNTFSLEQDLLDGLDSTELPQICRSYLENFEVTVRQNNDVSGLLGFIANQRDSLLESNLSEYNKALLLGATSIAYYSLDYWYSASNNSSSPYFNLMQTGLNNCSCNVPNQTRFWADVAGFIDGFVNCWGCEGIGERINIGRFIASQASAQ